jgi:Zn-dependent peptidase ImmA (M78 family)/transcriptional regulator with XRE-family HTH domain
VVTGSGVHGNVLETVRLARGVTQAGLATLSGLSQAAISKAESGTAPLPADRVEQVAVALKVTPELLAGDQLSVASATACIFHRKRASTTIGQTKQARAKLALARLHAEALLDLIGAPEVTLPRTSPTADGYVTPDDVARQVRAALGLPSGPLENLVETLERAGAIVMTADLGGRRLDALSDWLAGRRPVLLVNDAAPGERQRFTLAHETGHAVMHQLPAEGLEEQADRFASELLMPAADIRNELQNPTLERLLVLKQRWKVSAAALARRAYDLGLIGDYPYRKLNTDMSASGWRTAEPVPLAAERPRALAEALQQARKRLDDVSIAARVCLLPDQLDEMFDDRRTA